jgi:hypothetical protein
MGELMLLKGDVTIHAPQKMVWDFPANTHPIGQYVSGAKSLKPAFL